MPKGKWFRIGYGIIIVLLILLLAKKVQFVFEPIFVLVRTLFTPIIIAVILYYLTRPIVDFLSKKIPRPLAVVIMYLSGIGLIAGLIVLGAPEIQRQFNNFVNNIPDLINDTNQLLLNIQDSRWFQAVAPEEDSITQWLTGLESRLTEILSTVASHITDYVGMIASTIVILIVVPFVLFYLLKDGERLPKRLIGFLPKKYRDDTEEILDNMDEALSSYIQGQVIVACFVGALAYIGYLILGLPYALILGLTALFTNFIPFIGPWIGTAPGVIVGFFESPVTALLVVVMIVIIQQIESNLISPQVMGKKLDVHPITIIFLLLFAGSIGGIVAMIVAVPAYAVGKVIVSHIWQIIKLRNKEMF